MKTQKAELQLENGMIFSGTSFGHAASVSGEIVFNTGMTGYPESLTDPSYKGEILTLTYPLIGNYGVPAFEKERALNEDFESANIQIKALIISEISEDYSHWKSVQSLAEWLKRENIPAISGIDTRALTQVLRENGTMLGKIIINDEDVDYLDPNKINLVSQVSIPQKEIHGHGDKRIALLDCGCKYSIIRNFIDRGFEVLRLPWDADLKQEEFDALFISNGPGDPEQVKTTIDSVRWAIEQNIPTMGICLGHQIMGLAAGAKTYKLKYGHRSQNQPVMDLLTKRCYITSQNHGYAVDDTTLPEGWQPWFKNLNDNTSEGLIHESGIFKSVQFHPEAEPGPTDTLFIFDRFIDLISK